MKILQHSKYIQIKTFSKQRKQKQNKTGEKEKKKMKHKEYLQTTMNSFT
jgi:hypothetical protein